tara:strand:- start:90 stop:212 length:123 start_codon:yes stop_codon:yes gene_type:complete
MVKRNYFGSTATKELQQNKIQVALAPGFFLLDPIEFKDIQ